MNRADRRYNLRVATRYMAAENANYSEKLEHVQRSQWPNGIEGMKSRPAQVMRSRAYFVQIYEEPEPALVRLTVNRTALNASNQWEDGIPWDELQRLKREAGYGDRFAVEVYPADADVVCESNMRHLFVLTEPPEFAWRKPVQQGEAK